MNRISILLSACLFCWLPSPSLFAGMPSALPEDIATVFQLHEEPKQRLQAISFFIAGIMVSTLLFQLLWNSLAKDFTRIPRLSFFRALVVIIMWGTLFVIILTMISGARELMTPGAWKKTGITYTLDKPEKIEGDDRRTESEDRDGQ